MTTDTIRPAELADTDAILDVALASGLFPAEELDGLKHMLDETLQAGPGNDHYWIVDGVDAVRAAAYYAPEVMANGTWNLYFIAVCREAQGQGIGSALLRTVEMDLTKRGARLLIIETSGLLQFDKTRQFYAKHGYDNEARIRDFYDTGDDKIVFRKAFSK